MKTGTLVLLAYLVIFSILTSLYLNTSLNVIYNKASVKIYIDQIIQRVDELFLSVTLDSNILREHWKTLDLNSEKVQALALGLSPAFLRVGGNDADCLIFSSNSNKMSHYYQSTGINANKLMNFTMSTSDWDLINKFSNKVNWKLIFDLNVLLRKANNAWDFSNAESLIEFSSRKGYKLDFQLGNEPNNFPHKFGMNLTGQRLAKDYHQLRSLLNKYPLYKLSMLLGPEITRPKIKFTEDEVEMPSLPYLYEFLQYASDVVDIITWHQYYFDGKTAEEEDFIDPNYFDIFESQITAIKTVVKQLGINKSIWLTETSTGYGGGTPYLSNRYAAIFLWLDKLGLSASQGINVVNRQSFYDNNYGLIDKDLNPLPDYWVSLIYKKIVGPRVLKVEKNIQSEGNKLRVYAHCTPTINLEYQEGSVTLYVINLFQNTIFLQIDGTFSELEVDEYSLTPSRNDLHAKYIKLNGIELHLLNDTTLPELRPRRIHIQDGIKMMPLTIGFYVFLNANVDVCL